MLLKSIFYPTILCIMNMYKKAIFLSLTLFLFVSGYATNYYVSTTDGNDSYSAAQAQNPSTPWQSLPKVNSIFSSLKPGDNLLFKRGDIFYGSLVVNASGNSSAPITIGAYGSGNRPLISGFVGVQNWSNVGNGMWQSTLNTSATNLNLITINGVSQAMGRYPNSDAVNGGYLTYESFGYNSITDNQLSGSPNWTGASAVIRKTKWILDVCKITNHSGTTINYNNPTSDNIYPGLSNFGYFIQNDPRTLDKLGEWYFNPSNKTLQMYFGANSPGSYGVSNSYADNIVSISNNNNIIMDNIAVEGGNSYGITVTNSISVTIQNCDVNNSGNTGIYVRNVPNILLQYNTVNSALTNGINVLNTSASPSNVKGNVIQNIGLLAGMSQSGDMTNTGLSVQGDNVVVQNNSIQNTGYNGLAFQGSNSTISNNFINNYCSVKDDGGGIYTYAGASSTVYSNRKITGNIILNGIGAKYGTDPGLADYGVMVMAIYLDGSSSNIDITDNSISGSAGSGFYLNNINSVNFLRNTIFNTRNAVNLNRDPNGPLLRNNTFKQNIVFPLYNNQNGMFYWNGELNVPTQTSIQADMQAIGVFDNNYYRNDVLAPFDYYYHLTNGGTFVDPPALNFTQWKSFMNQDFNSSVTPGIASYKINNVLSSNLLPNGAFTTGISNVTFWSVNNNFTSSWDNSNQISGGSLQIAPNSSTSEYSTMYAPAGSVVAGKNYILRITTKGTTVNGFMRASLRQTNSPYSTLTSTQSDFFGNTVQTHEFLISPTATEANASYLIEILQSSGTVYIDNIEIYEVNYSNIDPGTQVRFEYNASTNNQTVTLDANYLGVDNTKYSGSVTLAPYTSKIFIRDTSAGTLTVPSPPASSTLKATGSTTPISCFGGTTTVNISANGGVAPYAGTGSFTSSAGTGALKLSFSNPSTGNTTYNYWSIGAVDASKIYVLKFSTLGTTGSGTVKASLRQTASPYASLISGQTASFGTTRVDHQFTFVSPTSSPDASFLIEISENSGTTYIDNIAFFLAASDGSLISQNLYPQGDFENASTGLSSISTWSVNNNTTSVYDNNSVINAIKYYSVTDATGAINTTGVNVNQPTAALQATATASPILSGQTSTTVTVNATGGTAPYSGTGSFSVGVGTYSYTVTDAKGCTSVASITVTAPITSPVTSPVVSVSTSSTLRAATSASPVSCFGGTTTVNVGASGGTGPYTGTGSYPASAGTGSLKLSFYYPQSTNFTYAYWSIGALSSSKYYVLKFTTLGTTANGTVQAWLRNTASPYATLTSVQQQTFGASSVEHEFFFWGASSPDANFLIAIQENSGTTYIDNIGFFEASSNGRLISSNLYPQGDFENDYANGISAINTWSLNNNKREEWDITSKINANNYYSVTDATGALNTTAITINQPGALLQASASVASSGSNYAITVSATGGTQPYNGVGAFIVGTGTYSYTVSDAGGCSSTVAVTAGAGARIATTTTSSLSTASTLSTSTINSLTIFSFPNPSTTLFNVVLAGGTAEMVEISVMSYDGKLLYKTKGTSNKKYTFGSNFIPGIYTVLVRQGTFLKSLKLVKGKF